MKKHLFRALKYSENSHNNLTSNNIHELSTSKLKKDHSQLTINYLQ